LYPWNAVQQVLFYRHRDQLLDLLSRQAEGLGLYLDVRWLKLRINIYGRAVELVQTNSKDPDGGRHHEPRKPQRCTYNPLDHRAPYGW
jgi:hypothetical protein